MLALLREVGRLLEAGPATGVMLATPTGEQHVLALRMVGDLLREVGCQVVMLGPDMPAEALAEAAVRHAPHVICLSSTVPGGTDSTLITIHEIQRRFPSAGFVIGGRAISSRLRSRPGISVCAKVWTSLRLLTPWPSRRSSTDVRPPRRPSDRHGGARPRPPRRRADRARPLAELVADRYFAEFPDDLVTYGEAARPWEVYDTSHCLQWAFLDQEDLCDLEKEVTWLADVLRTRGFPLARLARNLELSADVLTERLGEPRRRRPRGCASPPRWRASPAPLRSCPRRGCDRPRRRRAPCAAGTG